MSLTPSGIEISRKPLASMARLKVRIPAKRFIASSQAATMALIPSSMVGTAAAFFLAISLFLFFFIEQDANGFELPMTTASLAFGIFLALDTNRSPGNREQAFFVNGFTAFVAVAVSAAVNTVQRLLNRSKALDIAFFETVQELAGKALRRQIPFFNHTL